MGLQKKFFSEDIEQKVEVNVYDIFTKQIVFSGTQKDAATFCGVRVSSINLAAKRKNRIQKKYAVRLKSTNIQK